MNTAQATLPSASALQYDVDMAQSRPPTAPAAIGRRRRTTSSASSFPMLPNSYSSRSQGRQSKARSNSRRRKRCKSSASRRRGSSRAGTAGSHGQTVNKCRSSTLAALQHSFDSKEKAKQEKERAKLNIRSMPPRVRKILVPLKQAMPKLAEDELVMLYKAFDALDTESFGSIERADVVFLFHYLGIHDQRLSGRAFDLMSSNRMSTRLTLEELCQGLYTIFRGTQDQQLLFAFQAYDLNDDGFITRVEMLNLLKSALSYSYTDNDLSSTEQLVSVVLSKFDANDDGRVDFDEYRDVCRVNPLLVEAFGKILPHPDMLRTGLVKVLDVTSFRTKSLAEREAARNKFRRESAAQVAASTATAAAAAVNASHMHSHHHGYRRAL